MAVGHLTDGELYDIRRRYWETAEPLSAIGRDYGIHRAEVYQLAQNISRRTDGGWPESANPGDPRPSRTTKTGNRLSDRDVVAIREFISRASGPQWGDLERMARAYDVTPFYIGQLARGKARPDAGGPIFEGDFREVAERPTATSDA